MLISRGKVSGPWAAIDPSVNDSRIDEAFLGVSQWLARQKFPFQLLFPMVRLNSGVKEVSPHLFVRAASFDLLDGIEDAVHRFRANIELMRDGKGHVIPIEDSFVQSIIETCRNLASRRSEGIAQGSFVRILYGKYGKLCGTVKNQPNGHAEVVIEMRTRQIVLNIPTVALENLGAQKRDYFYSGL